MNLKKNLLIHIESSFGELDSFLPFLYYLNNTKRYVIIFFDNTFRINIKTENNVLYLLAKDMSDEIVILRESRFFNFIIRVLQFINRSFKFNLKILLIYLKELIYVIKLKKIFF